MLEFATPEFLLLAFPVWYGFFRWTKLPGSTAWLLAFPAWAVFVSWNLPADTSGLFWKTLDFAQTYGGWLLPIPLWLGLRHWATTATVTHWLRLALVAGLLMALGGPRWNIGGKGLDIIIVADRSRSLPDDAREEIRELIDSLQSHRKPGDRLAVVAFAAEPQLEQPLSETQTRKTFQRNVNPDGSDLQAALYRALSLLDPDRPARIIVLGDGEANGLSPFTAARRAREENVPIDVRIFERQRVGDVAVERVSLPRQIAPHEPFLFTATVYADGGTTAVARLERESVVNGQRVRKPVAEKTQRLHSGRNAIQFGDVLSTGGTHRYFVTVDMENDPQPENNRWEDEIFVETGPRLLLLVKDDNATDGRLAKTLTHDNSGIPTDVRVARQQPLSKLQLDRYRAVVLEDVPADHLGYLKMARLSKYVTDLGGGVMLTGGENSFGSGGYFKSPLDPILPVSMELREEHHKLRVAIAVVLDRSGSMRALVPGGQTKISLANQGAAECVRLLSQHDVVSVIAVDTQADVTQPLTPIEDKTGIIAKVESITSRGGGIYADVALQAARKQLDNAKQRGYQTRHVILFSDARDTELSPRLRGVGVADRQAKLVKRVKEMKSAGMTVSVIGLGTQQNVHADFLKAIANAGGGRAMFTDDARDLPRLFTQDTMNVARNTFLRKDDDHPDGFAGRRLPGPFLIGQPPRGRFPNVDGFNLTYARPEAQVAVVSADEYQAPFSAFWYRGLGRVAAIPLDVSGTYAGDFARWEHRRSFLLAHARWLLSGSDPREMYMEIERQGQEAVVTLEFDPRNPRRLQNAPQLRIVPPGEEPEAARSKPFRWIDHNRLETRFRLDRLGIFRTRVVTGANRSMRGPSIALPYSPEFFPRAGMPSGRETLEEITRLSGGRERTDVLEVLDRSNLPRLPRMVSMLPFLGVLTILVLLVEIAGRRLALWERRPIAETAEDEAVTQPSQPAWWRRWRLWGWKRRPFRKSGAGAPARMSEPEQSSEPRETRDAAPSISRVIEQAKEQARRRRRE